MKSTILKVQVCGVSLSRQKKRHLLHSQAGTVDKDKGKHGDGAAAPGGDACCPGIAETVADIHAGTDEQVIGRTTYKVALHSSQTSRKIMANKVRQLILHDRGQM